MSTSSFYLVVKQPFDSYKRGDAITDPDTIAAILLSGNAHYVVETLLGSSTVLPGPSPTPSPTPVQPAPTQPSGGYTGTLAGQMPVRIIVADTVAVATDYLIGVLKGQPGSPTKITLDDSIPEQNEIVVKDMNGDAFMHPITVQSDLLIDGLPSFVLTNSYQSETFYRTSTGWSIL